MVQAVVEHPVKDIQHVILENLKVKGMQQVVQVLITDQVVKRLNLELLIIQKEVAKAVMKVALFFLAGEPDLVVAATVAELEEMHQKNRRKAATAPS